MLDEIEFEPMLMAMNRLQCFNGYVPGIAANYNYLEAAHGRPEKDWVVHSPRSGNSVRSFALNHLLLC